MIKIVAKPTNLVLGYCIVEFTINCLNSLPISETNLISPLSPEEFAKRKDENYWKNMFIDKLRKELGNNQNIYSYEDMEIVRS